MNAPSIKKKYRIITEFDLDVPDDNYVLVTHEREGLSKNLIGYSLQCQRLTVYSLSHPREGRFRRRPENVKSVFERCDEHLDYMI